MTTDHFRELELRQEILRKQQLWQTRLLQHAQPTISSLLVQSRLTYVLIVRSPQPKANASQIGHLEAAAGIAGVIKSILILEKGAIPPNIHFNNPNPKIKFDDWKLHIPTEITDFPSQNGIRRISVNSFGYAGTNAHAILDDRESYLRERGLIESDPVIRHRKMNSLSRTKTFLHAWTPQLFLISAQDKHGVARVRDRLLQYLAERTTVLEGHIDHSRKLLAKLAFTLGSRRSHLQWREPVIASSLEELVQKLSSNESSGPLMRSSRPPRLGFVFTGQGAQWPRMGVELMSYAVFEEAVHSADVYLREICLCPWSAVEELEKSKSTSLLHLAEFSQTLCAVLQVALVDLLRSWGIRPSAVAGHSSGEIGAAYALGALSREDAWRTAYFRGMLSAGMKIMAPEIDGSMMAVGLSPDKAEEWISKVSEGYLVVACINSPTSVTVSGDTAGIDQLLEMLKEAGVFARRLLVDTAYHSPHMHNIAQEYYERLADLEPLPPTDQCTMHSSVTGRLIDASQLGVVNWVRNLTSPVRFSDAIFDMVRPIYDGHQTDENAIDVLVEIGPHSALQGPVMQTLSAHKIAPIPYHSVVIRNQNAVETALNLVGMLWARGYDVDIQAVNAVDKTSGLEPLVDLPAYPWKHAQRYYHNIRTEKAYLFRPTAKTSLIGAPIPSNNPREHTWRHVIRLSEESWVGDHQIQGSILYPAAGYMAMALEAASQVADVAKHVVAYKMRDVQFMAAAIVSSDEPLECIIQLRPHVTATRDPSSTWTEFMVGSCSDGNTLITNCSGLLLIEYEDNIGSEISREKAYELHALKDRYAEAQKWCESEIDCEELYDTLTAIGLQYGPAFANVCQARTDHNGHSFGQIRIPDVLTKSAADRDRPHVVHPGTLDAVFHLVFATIMGKGALNAMVPKFISEVTVAASMPWQVGTKLPGFSRSERHGLRDLIADVVMFSYDQGPDAINIQGLTLTEVGGGSALSDGEDGIRSIASTLIWKPAVDLMSPAELSKALSVASSGASKLIEVCLTETVTFQQRNCADNRSI
jgi:zearalenone synthase (highly reducing iterative type I polyketide synthase)